MLLKYFRIKYIVANAFTFSNWNISLIEAALFDWFYFEDIL